MLSILVSALLSAFRCFVNFVFNCYNLLGQTFNVLWKSKSQRDFCAIYQNLSYLVITFEWILSLYLSKQVAFQCLNIVQWRLKSEGKSALPESSNILLMYHHCRWLMTESAVMDWTYFMERAIELLALAEAYSKKKYLQKKRHKVIAEF